MRPSRVRSVASSAEADEVLSALEAILNTVTLREWRHRLGVVKDAFTGRAAVQALYLHGAPKATSASVAALGASMITQGLVRHVTCGERALEDSDKAFYVVTPLGRKLLQTSEPQHLYSLSQRLQGSDSDALLVVEVSKAGFGSFFFLLLG